MRHRLEYLIVRALIAIVGVTPGPIVRAAGTMLGLAFYTLDGAHRRIAQRNLATAFPSRPAANQLPVVTVPALSVNPPKPPPGFPSHSSCVTLTTPPST